MSKIALVGMVVVLINFSACGFGERDQPPSQELIGIFSMFISIGVLDSDRHSIAKIVGDNEIKILHVFSLQDPASQDYVELNECFLVFGLDGKLNRKHGCSFLVEKENGTKIGYRFNGARTSTDNLLKQDLVSIASLLTQKK